jgi:hypothetical protein
MVSLNTHQTRRMRLRAQLLLAGQSGLPTTPAQTLAAVCGVQAQDLPAGLLSIRARSTGLTAFEIEQARQGGEGGSETRPYGPAANGLAPTDQPKQAGPTIAWTWCLRGTLHLVTAEDASWLVALLGPASIAGDRRRFQQLGWDEPKAAKGLRLVQEALQTEGALTRAEIIRLLKENDLPSEGQAPVHLLYRAAMEGMLCAGPNRGKEPAYVLWESWLGKPRPRPHQEALAELARRYLQAYAPAGPQDLASWSGLKLGEARQAWQLIAGQLMEVEAAGEPAWLLESQLPWLEETLAEGSGTTPQVSLLPRFDTYLLGYASRDLAVDPAYARRIHPGGGIINAALLVDGRALGTWKVQRRRGGLEVQVEPFEPLAGALLPGVEAEAADVGRFLGVEAVLVVKK